MTAFRGLHRRLRRLEGARAAEGRMLTIPLAVADDPAAVAALVAAHRERTGWRGRVALIAVPEEAATMEEWALRYAPAQGSV